MILRKLNKITKTGLVLKKRNSNLYWFTRWDTEHKAIVAYTNMTCMYNPTFEVFDVVGEIGKNFIQYPNGDLQEKEYTTIDKNDIYDLKNEKGKVVDAILISTIKYIKDKPYYHIIHKDGSVEILTKEDLFLLNIQPKNKKFLAVHYQLTR